MPRVSTTSQEQPVEKQPTRRRAAPKPPADGKASTIASKTVVKKPARKTPVKRKTATKKLTSAKVEPVEQVETVVTMSATTTTRKAPTEFADQVARKKATRTQAVVIGVLLTIGVGASAAVGFTDSEAGQIDVAQTISDRTERMANMVDVDGPTVVAPRQNSNNAPDGGFLGVQPIDPPTPPTAAELEAMATASSSAQIATTTDSVEADALITEGDQEESNSNAAAMDSATTTVTATTQSDSEVIE
jgi:hypothetical protein